MLINNFIQIVKNDIKNISNVLRNLKNGNNPFDQNLAICCTNGLNIKIKNDFNLNEIFESFLWSAPKKRRPVEKRLQRKFGYWDQYNPTSKLIKKKHNIVICDNCGEYHELENICQKCYFKVKEETKIIQKKIAEKLGLNPVEEEVIISYENDPKIENKSNYFVEIPKERPVWFNSNLTSNLTREPNKQSSISENNDLQVKVE